MKTHHTRFPLPLLRGVLAAAFLAGSLPLAAADWQKVETFPNGAAEGTWTAIGTPVVDTTAGYLSLKVTGASTSTYRVSLPQTYTTGKFTIAFDLYLPKSPWQNQAGFGIGSASQATKTGWSPIGTRNRFQTVNPYPQNIAKVPLWSSDIFAPTTQGVWYNVWLVYDLGADPKTVTTYTKPATTAMEPANLVVNSFTFDGSQDDDWSAVEYFGFGIGLFDNGQTPSGKTSTDTLGLLADNIYVATGENVTLTPTAFTGEWAKVETFPGNAAEGQWTTAGTVTASFDNGSLLLKAGGAFAGLHVPLPNMVKRGSTTITFDMLLPSGGLNNAAYALIGSGQTSQTGNALFGGNDRFLTFGTTAPQKITKWQDLTFDLVGTSAQDQWYHVWMVYDNDAATVDFYGAPFTLGTPGTAPAAAAKSYALQSVYPDFSRFIVGGWNSSTAGIRIDNIYQSYGRNISLSPTAGYADAPVSGLTPGQWNATEIGWVFGYTPEWGYSIFMGFVYVADLPWIYQAPFGWMYVAAAIPNAPAEGTSYWFYSPTLGWVFANDAFGGFFQAENNGWAYDNFLNPNP